MSILIETMSEDGVDAMVLLCREELRNVKVRADRQSTNLPFYLHNEIKSLQFYLKHLQKKALLNRQ